jgi:dephospho-CoA kinase
MLRIGLTGGIGSGKSVVAKIFETLGIPVYYADDASKRLMSDDEQLKNQVKNAFGDAAYIKGKLNREYLSEQVFNDIEKLTLLNSFVHPATIKDADQWIRKQKAPYIVKEAALIFESGSQKNLDYVIGVRAPEQLRLQRAMQRDNISSERVIARMSNQMDEEEKLRLCDFVIVNDEKQLVIPQALALHKKFLEMESIS